MKIESIEISVFELPMYRSTIRAMNTGASVAPRWQNSNASSDLVPMQVIRVRTNNGVDGVCTVGDWRYTEISSQQLGHLRQLTIGEDPLNRDRIYSKLRSVARFY
ncbi:MAG: hypothetical protein QGI88_11095, partial [SAR202 cluster bacterium]|nr:hypothetical protein [SAR202 cluster bacterium]